MVFSFRTEGLGYLYSRKRIPCSAARLGGFSPGPGDR